MSPLVGLALALGAATAAPSFRADFPGAKTIASTAGGRLVQASGFSASGLGATPEAAARAFLRRYGADFGIGARQELVARRDAEPGSVVAVAFERRIAGAPLFDADVVVGVDASGAVILVNAVAVPARVAGGRARVSRAAAIRAARAGLEGLAGAGPPAAERGWRAGGDSIRPVWRVDFVAERPPGAWRTYVDAQTGKVLFRMDRRASLGPVR